MSSKQIKALRERPRIKDRDQKKKSNTKEKYITKITIKCMHHPLITPLPHPFKGLTCQRTVKEKQNIAEQQMLTHLQWHPSWPASHYQPDPPCLVCPHVYGFLHLLQSVERPNRQFHFILKYQIFHIHVCTHAKYADHVHQTVHMHTKHIHCTNNMHPDKYSHTHPYTHTHTHNNTHKHTHTHKDRKHEKKKCHSDNTHHSVEVEHSTQTKIIIKKNKTT